MENYLGSNIRRYRLAAGLTQRELAEQLDVQPNTVSDWERGRSEPSAAQIAMIARILDVTVNDLFASTDKAEPSRTPPPSGSPPDHTERLLRVLETLTESLREREETERMRIREAEETRRLEIMEVAARQQRNIELLLSHLLGDDASARVQGHSEAAAVDAGD